ncbi:hypothetical protein CWB35_15520 [Bacillus cereus]|uniref:hypothetical protein n=1 Tax=Bacillus cereus TaxID=1396 RepID=UPI0010BF3D8C|nr:hypothetical protein [Bacillus cereus]MBR9661809.1 hypothetical protein [Bacillus cereus]TKH69780.1 hypothetical protein FC676_20665 [Bacillus cereus]
MIYQRADENILGANYSHQVVEHFEKTRYPDEEKFGTYVNLFDTTESVNKIFYKLNCMSTLDIRNIAQTIVNKNTYNYNQQYRIFISYLQENNMITSQL